MSLLPYRGDCRQTSRLLADLHLAILRADQSARGTDRAITLGIGLRIARTVSAIAIVPVVPVVVTVIAVVIGIGVTERRGLNRARRAQRAADDARRDITRPESRTVTIIPCLAVPVRRASWRAI